MLPLIVKALSEFNESGLTTIVETEGIEPKEVLAYVLPVLTDLKCCVEILYDEDSSSISIVDKMMEN